MRFDGLHEKTLVLIKPDAVQRGLIGEIMRRFELKGLKVVGLKMMSLEAALLQEHYAHIKEKPFYSGVERFMMSSPLIAVCLEGLQVVDAVRLITGVTKARTAEAGSIRGDLAMGVANNVVHTSDSVANAEKEVRRFFHEDELFTYDKTEYLHVYGEDERA